MDSVEAIVAGHYGSGQVMARIRAALARADLDETGLTAIDLAPVDELHPGGAEATEALLAQLGLGPDTRALDLGCGVGEPARLIADCYGASVTGVDLTAEYVEAARELSAMVGIGDRLRFLEGSVTDLPVADGSADLALLQHVGMNVADKPALFREAARALAPGGTFALFEAMRGPDPSPLRFPLPWAASPQSCFVAAPGETLLRAALAAGVRLPSSCRNGTCRTCIAQVVEGRIEHTIEWPGLSREEKAEGGVLPCVAVALSPLVLRLGF